MTILRNAIGDFQLANPIYIGAVVSFFTVDPLTGAKTTTLATLYAGATGATTALNPQTLDGFGKFFAPVYLEVPVIAEVVGINAPSHDVGPIQMRGRFRGSWVTATAYFSSDIIQDGATLAFYIAAGDYVSGATVAADVAASHLVAFIDPSIITAFPLTAANQASGAMAYLAASKARRAVASAAAAAASAASITDDQIALKARYFN